MEQTQKKYKILAEYGLHARPASGFVKKAISIPVPVEVIRNNIVINGKSLVEVMGFNIMQGDEITIIIHDNNPHYLKLLENYLKENQII